jgi:hypothetical protein
MMAVYTRFMLQARNLKRLLLLSVGPDTRHHTPSSALQASGTDSPLHRLLELLQVDAPPGIPRRLLCERPLPAAGEPHFQLLTPAPQLLGVLYRRSAEQPLEVLYAAVYPLLRPPFLSGCRAPSKASSLSISSSCSRAFISTDTARR